MSTLTLLEQKEIAEALLAGLACYRNRHTGEIITFPDPEQFPETGEEMAEEQAMVKDNPDDYFAFGPLQPHDNFEIMEAFVDALHNRLPLKEELTRALRQKHPFRHFKFVIDKAGDYREQWFAFRDRMLRAWVQDQFERFSD